jgi:5-methylcytosine-specific restriction protein B
MIYLKKIVNQDLERTPTFNVESIRYFFKITLENGQYVYKKLILIPGHEEFNVKFQKRETRDEFRVFLNEIFQKINPKEGDILLLRNRSQDEYTCEHINNQYLDYEHYNHLFEENNNHQVIVDDIHASENESESKHINLLDQFVSWFIQMDTVKHNYFTDTFNKNKDKLKTELEHYEEIYENEFKSKIFTININDIDTIISSIKSNIEKKDGQFHEFSSKKSNHMPRAILGKNNYLKFLSDLYINTSVNQIDFNYELFHNSTKEAGLVFSSQLVQRFVASLCTKPFVICTGLSGSGKTKLAQAFVQWICPDESQYRIIPVGADWTNREPLLGYPNALKPEEYVKPDSGVLDLIIQATHKPELPYFLILDEMNLSHVERYFADFLSVMESKEEIPLYAVGTVVNGVPARLKVPSNLFIIGTVNIDETTNMFSPKVLDRANTIEFRVTQDEMKDFLVNIREINMGVLTGKGAGMSKSFMDMSANKHFATDVAINAALVQFFGELKKTGAEFGYRSAAEIFRLIHQLTVLNAHFTKEQKIDIAIMQKLLPKLHGSRRKLCPVLETLGSFCITGDVKIVKDVFEKAEFDYKGANVLYPLSLDKISRMYRCAIDNGFASFAEA